MRAKSDKTKVQRVSATAASRKFSRLLDEIEAGGRFLVHRRGRDVCMMAAPPVRGRRVSECLALLRGRAPVLLDDAFGADLLEIVRGAPVEKRPAWDS